MPARLIAGSPSRSDRGPRHLRRAQRRRGDQSRRRSTRGAAQGGRHRALSRQGRRPRQPSGFFEPGWTRRCRRARRSRTTCAGRSPQGARAALSAAARRRAPAGSSAVEALLRWRHPQRGPMPPGDVHPARRGERADPAARRMGAAQACSRPRSGPVVIVAVNLSPVQFRTTTWSALVARVLAETGLPPRGSSSRSPRAPAAGHGRDAGHADAAQGAGRAHRHGRFRHRLFELALPAAASRSTRSRSTSRSSAWSRRTPTPPPSSARWWAWAAAWAS